MWHFGSFLGGLLLGTCAALYILARWSLKYRGKRLIGRTRIPTVKIDEIDAMFRPDQLGMPREAEARIIGGSAVGGTNAFESWILAALAKRARRMFEFGTCTGKTTYAWAANSPQRARITTITLRPEDQDQYDDDPRDTGADRRHALRESMFDRFYYSGTDVEQKVEQLFGDSKQLDETPYQDECDMIFVDGSHAYSYVVSDSRKALAMVAPGGLILWHDYHGPHQAAGVYRALNELAGDLPLRRIANTSLVAYRKPAA